MTTSTITPLQAPQLRLFLSSTFSDMNAERDALLRVFPRVKELCAQRGVEFVPIDLRWGITEGAAKQGRVLETCMQEIDNARPFFVGIVGNRYGWSPSEKDLGERLDSLRERWDWMDEALRNKMSITEMEMQYAVLRKHDEGMNAAFYIRSERMPVSAECCDRPGSEDEAKLQKLKEKIRAQQRFPVADYDNPGHLADMVQKELQAFLDKEFPVVMGDSAGMDYRMHEYALASRTDSLFSLKLYQGPIDIWKNLPNMPVEEKINPTMHREKALCITGQKGRGKSYLLAQQVMKLRAEGATVVYADWERVYNSDSGLGYILDELIHALGIRSRKQNDRDSTLGCLLSLLRVIIKTPVLMIKIAFSSSSGSQDQIKDETAQWMHDMTSDFVMQSIERRLKPLRKRLAKGVQKPIYVAVDNLDSLGGDDVVLFAILHSLPHVRFLYTASTGTHACLHLRDVMRVETIEMENLYVSQAKEYINNYLARYGKRLDESGEQCLRIVKSGIGGSPLLLSYVLHLMVCFGSFEELDRYITEVSAVKNEQEVFGLMVKNIREQFAPDEGGNVAAQVLAALALVPGGFKEDELVDLFNPKPLEWALVRPYVLNFCRTREQYYYYIPTEASRLAMAMQLKDCIESVADKLSSHYENLLQVRLQHTGYGGLPDSNKMQDDVDKLRQQVRVLPPVYLAAGKAVPLYRWCSYLAADALFTDAERMAYWGALYKAGYTMRNAPDPDMSPRAQVVCMLLYPGLPLDKWAQTMYNDLPLHSTELERTEMYGRWVRVAVAYNQADDLQWLYKKLGKNVYGDFAQKGIEMGTLISQKKYDEAIALGRQLQASLQMPQRMAVDTLLSQALAAKGDNRQALQVSAADADAMQQYMAALPSDIIAPAITVYGQAALQVGDADHADRAIGLAEAYMEVSSTESTESLVVASLLYTQARLWLFRGDAEEAIRVATALQAMLKNLNLNPQVATDLIAEARKVMPGKA